MPSQKTGRAGQKYPGTVKFFRRCRGISLLGHKLVKPVQGHVHREIKVDGKMIYLLKFQNHGHAHQRVPALIMKAQGGV